ncbi:MAG: ComEC/Rec2 family competence protein, partial [Rhodospirillales bacterium]|nr:ComEC/Rec2 family competence protein [Rhodospirillales bacterium]
ALLGPSFQMSFAAVIALISAYEALGRKLKAGSRSNWKRRAALYLAGIALTTVIATLATSPFAIYHFNRVALFGLAANMVAVPIATLWIMPAAILGMFMMPAGLEQFALVPMGWGIDAVVAIAKFVAGREGAVMGISALPVGAIIAIAFGGLWLCLWRLNWRYFGVVGVIGGMILAVTEPTPDVLISEKGKLFALKTEHGRMLLSSATTAKFAGSVWLQRAGVTPEESKILSRRPERALVNPSCDRLGCIWRVKGELVAMVAEPQALPEDCRQATVVISSVPVPWACPSAHTVIDRFDLWRRGAHAVWLGRGPPRVVSVNEARGRRPWVVWKPEKTARPDKRRIQKNATGKTTGAF